MQLPGFLAGPAELLRGPADSLTESVAALANVVLRQAPALRGPALDALNQLAGGLRESADAVQSRAARFDAPEGDSDVREAIALDATITDHQRRVLLNVYAAFQEENAAARKHRS